MDDVRQILERLQIATNILPMQIGHMRILLIIEPFGHKDALVSREGHRLRKYGLVDVIGGAPGGVHPMGTGLEDIVLEIMLQIEQFPYRGSLLGKLMQAIVIPSVVLCEVVEREPVPC